jgi:glutamyl-tRNA reductase
VLDQLGMIGISWRHGQTEALADFTLDPTDAPTALKRFANREGLAELAYIATCNRVELIFKYSSSRLNVDLRPQVFEFLTGRLPALGEAERSLRAWQGEGAAEHLFLVAAGLDSACVGETEIVGQVRASHTLAKDIGLIGPTLDLVFEEAARIAARVRGETALGRGRVSLAEIAVEAIRERLDRTPGNVALVGVSPMTERAAKSLSAAGHTVIVVNRSIERAAALANEHDAAHLSLADFLTNPPPVEALLSATAAGAPIILGATLERLFARTASGVAPLIIDMAVPGDVSAEACRKLSIPRIGMDEIVARAELNRKFRLTEAAEAREHVDRALETLQERIAERYYGPLLGALQRRYQRTAEEGVRRLMKKDLQGLGSKERAAIEAWAGVLARRFAHIPCVGLRGLINVGPEGSIEAFLSGLEPEFADELKAALAGGNESNAATELAGHTTPQPGNRPPGRQSNLA